MLHAGYNGRPSGPSQVWSGQGTLTWYFGWSWYFLLNNSYLINFFLDYYNYLFYQLINFFYLPFGKEILTTNEIDK